MYTSMLYWFQCVVCTGNRSLYEYTVLVLDMNELFEDQSFGLQNRAYLIMLLYGCLILNLYVYSNRNVLNCPLEVYYT